MTDPLADMLTRLRNASEAMHERVDIPASRLKEEVLKILKEEGFITTYKRIEDDRQGILRVWLKYTPQRERVLRGARRISRPGVRIYRSVDRLPRRMRGIGVTVLTTSQGVMTARQARRRRVGGEVLAEIW